MIACFKYFTLLLIVLFIYTQLLQRKNETHGTKAILIEGAKHIGKAIVVEEFAKKNYKSYKFISNQKPFLQCEKEKRDILKTYRNVHKIDRSYKVKVLSIFDQIPSFLSRHEKRVKINSISTDDPLLIMKRHFFC